MNTTRHSDIQSLYQRLNKGMIPGLDATMALLDEMDHPERNFHSIHVAGTNGKGSVCAMLESMLRTGGVRTGLFTSPHILKLGERFRVNGRMPDDETVQALMQDTDQPAERGAVQVGRAVTFFEYITAMAFKYFSDQGVECGIIETGMGGRLDSTNVLQSSLTVITNIDMDHQKYLGDDIEQIAFEKAGIIKPNVPCVLGQLHPAAYRIIAARADELSAPVVSAYELVQVNMGHIGLEGMGVEICIEEMMQSKVVIPLCGRHQCENITTAVAAFMVYMQLRTQQPEKQHVLDGLQHTYWPARLEQMQSYPAVLLDGAHNPAGLQASLDTVQAMKPADVPLAMIFSILDDKDGDTMSALVRQYADQVWCVENSSQRTINLHKLSRMFDSGVHACASLEAAYAEALDWCTKHGGWLLIAGSLYLAGDFYELLHGASYPVYEEDTSS